MTGLVAAVEPPGPSRGCQGRLGVMPETAARVRMGPSSRGFDADGVGALVIDTRAGDVSVEAAEVEDVTVVSRATTGLFSSADLDLRLDGSELLLTSGCDGLGMLSCTVAFEVQVPHDLVAPLDVDTTAGKVSLRGLDDDVTVRTTAGTVRLTDYRGETAEISTTAGTIEVDAALATRSLDLHTTAGSIDVVVDDERPLRVDTDTVVGSVTVDANQAADADRVVVARTTAGEIVVTGR